MQPHPPPPAPQPQQHQKDALWDPGCSEGAVKTLPPQREERLNQSSNSDNISPSASRQSSCRTYLYTERFLKSLVRITWLRIWKWPGESVLWERGFQMLFNDPWSNEAFKVLPSSCVRVKQHQSPPSRLIRQLDGHIASGQLCESEKAITPPPSNMTGLSPTPSDVRVCKTTKLNLTCRISWELHFQWSGGFQM